MGYTVYVTESFQKTFEKKAQGKKAVAKVDKKEFGKIHKSESRWVAGSNLWQLRVGPFRVSYEIDDRSKRVIPKAILQKMRPFGSISLVP
ncbi:MAG: hypothetical protein KGH61_00940 [Candidatus Micrarchaeota archaeon]|nr:hypothetical protein [Candidatus Micrarchaeota archaeon]MDE1847500.1 hypothetical protein [Candidatus Micrarchaeota archaeon]MDE1863864.1 hypothetical protein [Candidatus Micrarchaeota archaeon]